VSGITGTLDRNPSVEAQVFDQFATQGYPIVVIFGVHPMTLEMVGNVIIRVS
jgi:hypothetical protein